MAKLIEVRKAKHLSKVLMNCEERESVLRALLRETVEALIWCSGSQSFAPEVKERIGWERGPQITIDRGLMFLATEYQHTGLGSKRSK